MGRPLQPGDREWLDYLRDIGFEDLYLSSPSASVGESSGREVAPAALSSAVATLPGGGSDGASRADLELVASEAAGCTACKLAAGRTHVVFGSGNPGADLMFIGEGPGAAEDRQGLPFVGPAGEKLTQIIGAIDIERADVYIANVVKCRPPGNRDPEPDEVAACRGFLDRQIDLVAPRVIVALGRVAAQTLLGLASPLGRMRGTWHEVRGVPTRVTYHPAALLRNSSFRRPTWDDMQVVRDRLLEGAR